MEINSTSIKNIIFHGKDKELTDFLKSGLDPNFEGGWPIRLAARHGSYILVKILIHFGANPHLVSESGASTLQLAVFSTEHWNSDKWDFLLSCCDSSQLADAAAVAVIFNNISALKKILGTGRCNTNIPTTLTGKTLEHLAKAYKLNYLINKPIINIDYDDANTEQRRIQRQNRPAVRIPTTPQTTTRNLSPSVARFFHQTRHTSLTPSPTRPGQSQMNYPYVNNIN